MLLTLLFRSATFCFSSARSTNKKLHVVCITIWKKNLVEPYFNYGPFFDVISLFSDSPSATNSVFQNFCSWSSPYKMVFCENYDFWRYFLRCILLSKIKNGIYKKCYFSKQRSLVEAFQS